jgi:predicted SprT family Zn-dependent metalloprotease
MKTDIRLPMREYKTLDDAYKFFNKKLFGGKLPDCLITIHHQGGRTLGFYSKDRFRVRGQKQTLDEIAMNPDRFLDRRDAEILSTLVHEMAHLWQWHLGNPARHGYHDREWAAEMERIGLMPSNTGAPGGKRTGQQMTHFIIKGGAFAVACSHFLDGAKIRFGAVPVPAGKRSVSKIKYSCGECGLNAWAKPDVHLICGNCEETMPPGD